MRLGLSVFCTDVVESDSLVYLPRSSGNFSSDMSVSCYLFLALSKFTEVQEVESSSCPEVGSTLSLIPWLSSVLYSLPHVSGPSSVSCGCSGSAEVQAQSQ